MNKKFWRGLWKSSLLLALTLVWSSQVYGNSTPQGPDGIITLTAPGQGRGSIIEQNLSYERPKGQNDVVVVEGDIAFTNPAMNGHTPQPYFAPKPPPANGITQRSNIIQYVRNHWTDGQVPIFVDRDVSLDLQTRIREAVERMNEQMTEGGAKCQFNILPNSVDPVGVEDYVHITDDKDGCWSKLGKRGGAQALNLAAGSCGSNGLIMHELAHAMGIAHEHVREDASKFITINEENIEEGKLHNFQPNRLHRPVGAYDCDSIMHYGPTFFSANGKPSFTPKNPKTCRNPGGGQANARLSPGDLSSMRELCGTTDEYKFRMQLPNDGKPGIYRIPRSRLSDQVFYVSSGGKVCQNPTPVMISLLTSLNRPIVEVSARNGYTYGPQRALRALSKCKVCGMTGPPNTAECRGEFSDPNGPSQRSTSVR